jgi:metal-dependent amidase/aminoacylase/carboxypeptidase family protein
MSQKIQERFASGRTTLLPALESFYKDIHSHPELSMQEHRTAGIAAERLRSAGYEVITGIGKTGVVGVLKNGDGPTIMLRLTWMRCRSARLPVYPIRALQPLLTAKERRFR